MSFLVAAAGYLFCSAAAYRLFAFDWTSQFNMTASDRRGIIGFSAFGPISLGAALIVNLHHLGRFFPNGDRIVRTRRSK